jgi:hypothetical protein
LAGAYNFTVKEIEVFAVNFAWMILYPVPNVNFARMILYSVLNISGEKWKNGQH